MSEGLDDNFYAKISYKPKNLVYLLRECKIFHHKKDSKVPKSWSTLFEISQDSMDLLEKEDLVIPDILKSMDAVITAQMAVCLCRLTAVFCKGLPL